MAITAASTGLAGRGRLRAAGSISEINVTPFVDVLLVLLVIFMLTAHVMEFGIEIEVPRVRPQKESAKELPVVSITKTGELSLNDKPANINDLAAMIVKRYGKNQAVYVRADAQVTFEPVAQVLAELGEARIPVNVVTKPDDSRSRR